MGRISCYVSSCRRLRYVCVYVSFVQPHHGRAQQLKAAVERELTRFLLPERFVVTFFKNLFNVQSLPFLVLSSNIGGTKV